MCCKRILAIAASLILSLSLTACEAAPSITLTPEPEPTTTPAQTPTPTPTPTPTTTPVTGVMKVYFLDVGQANATLLIGPDFTILIDAGDYRRDDVVPHLDSIGVTEIDLLIGTHPHADHIGQFPQVLESFNVKEVWMSGDEHTTQTFERAIDAILESDAAYHEPRAGEVFNFGSLTIEVLHPETITGDFHEGSISIRAVYGKTAFIFTGDAEVPEEEEMIARGQELNAQVLQLGHHGSRTSACQAFLNAVNPEVAIYSAGADNTYGHPHDEVVERVLDMGTDLYGTDVHGTIIVETNGSTYTIETEKTGDIRAPPEETVTPPATPTEPTSTDNGCEPGQININTATKEELQEIIHIGPARADELIILRPFSSLDDLTQITGISEARLKDIKEQGLACVGPTE